MTEKTIVKAENLNVVFPLFDSISRSMRARLTRSKMSSVKKFHALKNVNLTINKGERVGLLGQNGAGKTTLLRTLAGVYAPHSGRLDVNTPATSLFNVNVGTDQDASGYENIPLLMASRGIPLALKEDVTKDVEEFTELGEALYRPLRTYSAGMGLRIAFAVATYQSQGILLMDEVIGVGDQKFREKSNDRINSLMKDAATLVLASHANSVLQAHCERGVVFSKGEIAFDGSIKDAIEFHKKS